MPITKENRARYPSDWRAISTHVKTEAAWKCEWCDVEHGAIVQRDGRSVTIVLTVAHLDHTPENCDRTNLAALCQQCHNRYDVKHRQGNASKTRDRKRGQLRFDDVITPQEDTDVRPPSKAP
jgi:hypothetical protein